jgi:hypothetical protein
MKPVTLTEQEIAEIIAEKTAEKNREILAAKHTAKFRAVIAAAKKAGLYGVSELEFQFRDSRPVFW